MAKVNNRKHVAVLGAGITGCCLALALVRRGITVDLFDLEATPMSGASRWNEGKIHLGYLYAADTTLETAKRLIPGGLAFAPLMNKLIERPMSGYVTQTDDVFLIHRESIVLPEQAQHYYSRVSELVRACASSRHYLVDARQAGAKRLACSELAAIANPELAVAGFHIPERSVQTNWLADQLRAAVAAEPKIRQRMQTLVTAARPVDEVGGSWQVITKEQEETFDYVLNALWHGRIDIDCTAGIAPPVEWSNRYRLSLFVRTRKIIETASVVLAVGPYGDIKNYNGRDFYLSWYPAGMVCEIENASPDLSLPLRQRMDADKFAAIRRGLMSAFNGIEEILEHAEDVQLGGGYVFAQGRGSLSDSSSTLHRRDRIGVLRRGNYFSIDTGKYSIAPWLAESVVDEIAG